MTRSIAVGPSAVARVVGIETIFKDLRTSSAAILPQRIAVLAQGASDAVFDLERRQVVSAAQAGALYGYGSPIHLAVQQLLPETGDGVGTIPVTVYPLIDDLEGVASVGEITPMGTQLERGVYRVIISGKRTQQFTIAPGVSKAAIATVMATAINEVLDMPVKATVSGDKVILTAKWKGSNGDSIYVQVESPMDSGILFSIMQPSGGDVNPGLGGSIRDFGSTWETMVLNGLDYQDTDALDELSSFGEGRWGSTFRRPYLAFSGSTAPDPWGATIIPEDRKTDRVNVLITNPASVDLPFVVAARAVAKIAVQANENPACDYGSLPLDGLHPGNPRDQWDYLKRDIAVKRGGSTVEVRDNVVVLQDTVTMYHPTGELNPGYRYVCDVVKLMNVIFNIDLKFANPEWDGSPLIPDYQPTTNPRAKKPKMAIAEIGAVVDALGLEAIISDPDFTKKNTFAEIDTQNPKRLNIQTTVKLSGNTNILAVDLNFGFYFGTARIVG